MKWACFDCRKTFKMPQSMPDLDLYVCPDCKQPMSMMGKAFRPPKKENLEQWKKAEILVKNGFLFYKNAGARPKRLKDLPEFLASMKYRSPGEKLLEQFAQPSKPTRSSDQDRIRVSSREGKPKYRLLGRELGSWSTLEIRHKGEWVMATYRTVHDGMKPTQPHFQLSDGRLIPVKPNMTVRFSKS
jgi:DNA-directed RNA polymerase subunit RPC12/RpoP